MSCALVPLRNGRGIAYVDAADLPLVIARGPWYLHSRGYATTSGGRLLLHWLIMGRKLIDHKNGDRLDNQRNNLRPITYSANAFNRQVTDRRSISGVPGVTEQRANYFVVFIWRGKRKYLGARRSLLEAARLRAEGELEHFGEVSPATTAALKRLETRSGQAARR